MKKKKEDKKKTKELNLLKDEKKLIKYLIIILVIALVGFIVYKLVSVKKELYIEIASNDISYSYGPNGETETKPKVDDIIKLNIISSNNEKVKCYSTNKSIVAINENNIGIVLAKGNVDIYCKLGRVKSNIINVEVGE